MMPDLSSFLIEKDVDSELDWHEMCLDSKVWIDERRVKYSVDKKQLFEAPCSIEEYSILEGTITISDSAFNMCDSLVSIKIPNSVTYIGNQSFEGCKKLSEVYIPSSVNIIGSFAFAGCSSLKSIILNDGLSDIGNRAFDGCISLQSIFIPNSVNKIGSEININRKTLHLDRIFDSCKSLKSIYIPKGSKLKFDDLLSAYKDILIELDK